MKANGHVKWMLDYHAFPTAIVTLFDPRGRVIETEVEQKYNFTITGNQIYFAVKHVELKDAGVYKLRAENGKETKEVELVLIVEDKPTLMLDNYYVMEDTESTLECTCAGYPESVITWSFTKCSIVPSWPTCMEEESFAFDHESFKTHSNTEQSQTSTLTFRFTSPGRVFCSADNGLGSDTAKGMLTIGDLKEDLQVWGVEPENPISVNDEVRLYCGALVYNFTGPLNWYRDNLLVEESSGVQLIEDHTTFSYRKILVLSAAQKEDSGTYDCRAEEIESQLMRQSELQVTVSDALAPHLDVVNFEEGLTIVDLGGSREFQCVFSGIPRPEVKWYKDDVLVEVTNETKLYDGNTVLFIKYAKPEHQGAYKCVGENKVGIVTRSTQLELSGIPRISRYLLWGIPAVVMILLLAFLILFCRYRKTRRVSGRMNISIVVHLINQWQFICL